MDPLDAARLCVGAIELSLPEREATRSNPAAEDILEDDRGMDRIPRLVEGRTLEDFGFGGISIDAVLEWQEFNRSFGSPKLTFFVTERVSAIDVAGRTLELELVLRIDF